MIGAFAPYEMPPYPFSLILFFFFFNFPFAIVFAVKDRPELESKFEKRVQAAIRYARMIEDFGELIDPCTLTRHCLGPEPSLYVLSTLDREKKKCKLYFPIDLSSFSSFLTSYFLFIRP